MVMLDLWYKNTIVYCVDVETYMDSDGDGIGDFPGLSHRLDYIAGLGVTCIWLLPFYPSPNRDNGYDVTDYYSVDPRLGSLGDFVEFARQARHRGIRVIIDLVANHTSEQHPWFQQARQDANSRYRDYYVWSDEEPDDMHEGVIFPGVQDRIWSYDEQAGAYYLHRFYHHQPDLNIANPAVREEICKIMGFWLELGVSGFRVDAAPFLIEHKGIADAHAPESYAYLEEFRSFLSWRRGDAIMLAEANVPPEEVENYFGDNDRMHMLFNFVLNQHIFLALARGETGPIQHALQATPAPPPTGQWAVFLRNHDELDLGRLTPEQHNEICQAFNLTPDMWLYNRGPRRRLPPLLGGDPHRVRLAYSLALTLPGTPVIFYGEEIGMGDDLSLPERNSVRTPMQWSDEPNGGFSTAPPDQVVCPVISDETYGYQQVNVAALQRDPNSLLNWIERMIRTRKDCPELGWGEYELIETGNPAVLAHACAWRGGTVMALHNLSGEVCTITLDLNGYAATHLIDLLGDEQYTPVGDTHEVQLEGYGYRWFRVGGARH